MRSFLISHFLLVQNSSTKYQGWISAKKFDILMRRISFDRQTSSESLWQPEEHHRVGFYPHHHCPLTMVWSSEVYLFCFLNFASLEALIFSPIRNFEALFSHCKLAQPACFFPPEQANHSCLRKDSTFAELKLKFGVHVEFLLFSACFTFSFCLCISIAKPGLASRWRSTARFRATSSFHKELAKSDQSIN